MRRLAVLALAVLVAACGTAAPSGPPGPPGTPGTEPALASSPVTATDTQGRFILVFELPRSTWTTAEAISGTATLGTIDGLGAAITASGSGPFGFSFTEVGGTRQIGPEFNADCHPWTIEGGRPMTSPIEKSGGYSADDPDAPFYVHFFADPAVHLPAGTWDIAAVAWFVEGECGGPERDLAASVRVTVVDAPGG